MKKLIQLSIFLLLIVTGSVSAQQGDQDSMINSLNERVSKTEHDLGFWKKLKINGWIQAQYQIADTLGVGGSAPNASVAGGNFPAFSDNRFIIRRGRIKFTYENAFAQYVLQLDAVEPSPTNPTTNFAVNLRDFYAKVTMPFFTPLSLTVGLQNRPFGFEIAYSSQYREVPERSRFVQNLFPNERDLGAMITLQAPASSPLHIFKLNAGIFNGAGIAKEYDARKDFIGQLMMSRSFLNEKLSMGIGVSYYNGGVIRTDSTVYSAIDKNNPESPTFVPVKAGANIGTYSPREYFGVDAQFSMDHFLGITTLRGEYVWGTQPGIKDGTRSPEVLPGSAAYVRTFDAAYFYFVHNLPRVPFQLVFKYDWYDPNTSVSGTQVNSKGNFGIGDIRFDTYGYGLNYLVNANVKFMAYYDYVVNEIAVVNGYGYEKKDNIFTLRVQYRF